MFKLLASSVYNFVQARDVLNGTESQIAVMSIIVPSVLYFSRLLSAVLKLLLYRLRTYVALQRLNGFLKAAIDLLV